MKKLLALATALFLVLGVTTASVETVSAEGSVTEAVEISGATDQNGNAVYVTFGTPSVSVNEVPKAAATDKVLDIKEVTVPSGTTFPVTITFKSDAFKAGMTGYFQHKKADGTWERIGASFGNGTMTGTFTSLSPVAFVVKNGYASPNTADQAPIAIAAIALMAAVAGFVVVSKKNRA